MGPLKEPLQLGPLTPRTVHLAIDMQRLFAPGSPWASPWIERILPMVAAIAAHRPERTLFTRFVPPRRAEDMPGTWQRYYRRWPMMTREALDPSMIELLPPLGSFAPPAAIVDKSTYSAFSVQAVLAWLREREADGVIVTGAETDVCILATILGAVEWGYRVTIVTDAICSSWDPGHDALLSLYATRFSEQIDTADSETVLREWR